MTKVPILYVTEMDFLNMACKSKGFFRKILVSNCSEVYCPLLNVNLNYFQQELVRSITYKKLKIDTCVKTQTFPGFTFLIDTSIPKASKRIWSEYQSKVIEQQSVLSHGWIESWVLACCCTHCTTSSRARLNSAVLQC